jgi:antitoxin component of RelBE/YafQ-DinJ toxin-antitoxin module
MSKKAVLVSLDEEVWEETKRQCVLYGLKLSYVVNAMLKIWCRVKVDEDEK